MHLFLGITSDYKFKTKMKAKFLYVAIMMMAISSVSCGGDDDDDEISSSVSDSAASQFIGTWYTTNTKGYPTVYQFWEDGCAYIYQPSSTSNYSSSTANNLGSGHAADEDHSDNYKWTYDSSTGVLATTITTKSPLGPNSGDYGSTFYVTAYGDGFWSGYIQSGDDVYSYTFTQLTSNLYNP